MSIIHQMGYGLQKFYNSILRKLDTLKGNPQSIAKGFATGAAVSFTPFVGFHALLAIIIAKIVKQNAMAAVLGTILGNPWTFPLIWYADLHCGKFLLQNETTSEQIDFITLFKELFQSVIMLDFDKFFSDIYPIFFPMFIGCIPFCVATWIILSKLITKTLMQESSKEKNNDYRIGL